jgi:hypothetical protein
MSRIAGLHRPADPRPADDCAIVRRMLLRYAGAVEILDGPQGALGCITRSGGSSGGIADACGLRVALARWLKGKFGVPRVSPAGLPNYPEAKVRSSPEQWIKESKNAVKWARLSAGRRRRGVASLARPTRGRSPIFS